MKIAIAGYGVEGESSYHYFAANPENDITIVDESEPARILPEGVKTIIGEDVLQNLNGYDLVVRAPGLAPHKIKTDGKIWSNTNEFFSKCPAKIIGVTGSKGKGTTASLIVSMLRATGRKVWLIGNIGVPALDALSKIQPSDIVVFELSSFQLWDLERSPQIAVVLFIELEHQDVHSGMEEYVAAKANISRYQNSDDILVYNSKNQYARDIAESTKAHLIGYPEGRAAHVKDGYFWHGEQKICSVRELRIAGAFNQDNACAAISVVWQFTQNVNTIKKGLNGFEGLPHRLQLVREFEGVKYYDDSIATIPGAAIAALKSFEVPKVMIMGGSYKGSDFTDLATELAGQNAKVILIGSEASRMAEFFKEADFNDFEIIEKATMKQAVDRARQLSQPGGVVLLSPAAASFGLFKNYVDRGDQFQKAVKELGAK